MENTLCGNIYCAIKYHAYINPTRVIISVDGEEVSYGEFVKHVDNIAEAMSEMGVVADKKIGIIIPNSVRWYEVFWAAVKLGAQPVPFDPQVGEWEMEALLALADVEICFVASLYRGNNILQNIKNIRKKVPVLTNIISVDESNFDDGIIAFESILNKSEKAVSANPIHTPDEDQILMLACTSGSTGNPKIVSVPHLGFLKAQLDMAEYLDLDDSDIMLLGMPLYHQGGFGMGLQTIVKGGSVMYQTTFDPIKFLKLIQQKRITVVQLTATLAKILLSVPDFDSYDLSNVKLCYFAGEVLPSEVARVFFEKLNIRVVNVIGSTETATMLVWDSLYDRSSDNNDFRPLSFTQMRIMNDDCHDVMVGEVGIIYIHSDALLSRYYRNETETLRRIKHFDGMRWFNTGDVGMKLNDGRVRYAGRVKRIIKRGANLIYPEEIESFLLTHPSIEAIAVLGEKHDLIGEIIVAHIQVKNGEAITRGDILSFCRSKLAAYKIPDKIIAVDEIPHDIGKIQFKYLK